ncbi:sugar phosphate nucleotidyltransferase [Rothia sp. (in: high G+C Gram-positive bacteria)]|uniref:glucose-1-phosphate adenylyltransferase family protein n=1 Tax=Rothia sp. (in: high G+C Gram-positive bacteria) TaxID=1885016 RepID=UPI000ECC6803|nr:glucose-1-phosphate adenylyltransferase [Rothia sp. (in: high G+C Gram-positive bacteria)]
MSDPFPHTQQPPTVALVLAGGRGSRLSPLTDYRSKPAIPFAGIYRMIDVALSNLAHSGLRHVWVVEQYQPFTLNQHLAGGRPWDLDGTRDGLRILPPVQGHAVDGFASGNGHALYQQVPLLESVGARNVIVMSADHLYQLDLRPVLEQHDELGSDLTIVTTEIDEDASRYGVVRTDGQKVVAYDYKPKAPASQKIATEIFVFSVTALRNSLDALLEGVDRADTDAVGEALGDYGETLIPHLVQHGAVHEFLMEGYWKDVGTVDAYYRAHMDLLEGKGLQLDAPGWAIIPHPDPYAPAYIAPTAQVQGSLVAHGARVHGRVEHSVIGPGVTVEAGAVVERSIIMGDALIPAGSHLRAVIVDVGAKVPAEQMGQIKPGPGNITVLAYEGGGQGRRFDGEAVAPA